MGKYVYKVNANGLVFGDLNSAIDCAYKTVIKPSCNKLLYKERLSEPFTSKIQGGYKVIAMSLSGNIYQARIDVFVPASIKTKQYAVDNCKNKLDQTYFYYAKENYLKKIAKDNLADKYYDDDISGAYNEGYDDGYYNGKDDGYDDGYCDGKAEGYDEGYEEGYDEGQYHNEEDDYDEEEEENDDDEDDGDCDIETGDGCVGGCKECYSDDCDNCPCRKCEFNPTPYE